MIHTSKYIKLYSITARFKVKDEEEAKQSAEVVSAMAPVVLECPQLGCNLVDDGAKYKTPELEAEIEMAMEMLRFHMQGNHGQGQGITTASRNMRKRQKQRVRDSDNIPRDTRDIDR